MASLPPAPRLLDAFQGASPRARKFFLAPFVVAWLLLLAADWGGRFVLFHWHRNVISPEPAAASPSPAPSGSGYRCAEVPPRRGSTFSQAIPLPWLRSPYEEFHLGSTVWTDPDGYDNPPLPPGEHWQGVVVGDSFMIAGSTQTFARALSSLTGRPFLNRARAAAGPFLQLKRFVSEPPLEPPPGIMVWNLTSRELNGNFFSRQPVDSWFDARPAVPAAAPPPRPSRFHPEALHPAALARDWPNTSLPAYFARRAAAAFRLVVFRAWPRDALGIPDTPFGPVLFYPENLRYFSAHAPEDAPPVARTVIRVAERLRERGVTLVVVIVPEKEQIHLDLLPAAWHSRIAPSIEMLDVLEAELRANGVRVVNLLHPFLDAASSGTLLYWRDDPHWNPAAFSIAAGLVAEEIASVEP